MLDQEELQGREQVMREKWERRRIQQDHFQALVKGREASRGGGGCLDQGKDFHHLLKPPYSLQINIPIRAGKIINPQLIRATWWLQTSSRKVCDMLNSLKIGITTVQSPADGVGVGSQLGSGLR